MKLDFTVRRFGADTSGRALYFTVAFWTVWCAALADPRLDGFRDRIVVVQGAFMARAAGGGASTSAGYHDGAGCIDVRTWNLTLAEQAVLWAVMDDYGIRFWKRGPAAAMGGMDEHGHGLAVWDRVLASGAAFQADQARGGGDGLAGNGPDYMRREHPVLEQPPAHVFDEEMTMDPQVQQAFNDLKKQVDDLTKKVDRFRSNELDRDRKAADKAKKVAARQIATLGAVVDTLTEVAQADDLAAVQRRLGELKKLVVTALAADPDVDGADAPAKP